jgi:hypothetical protein
MQYACDLVLEAHPPALEFLFHIIRGRLNASLHTVYATVDLVILLDEPREMPVRGLELGDAVALVRELLSEVMRVLLIRTLPFAGPRVNAPLPLGFAAARGMPVYLLWRVREAPSCAVWWRTGTRVRGAGSPEEEAFTLRSLRCRHPGICARF